MKKYFCLVIFALIGSTSGVCQFSDDFLDGDFTQNPAWVGDTDKFVVSNNELQLNALGASGSGIKHYLSTESKAIIDARWKCKIRVNTAVTSGNYVRFYLVADTANLSAGSLKGYYIMVGGTSKEVALYRQSGSAVIKIIDGTDSRLTSSSTNSVEIMANRDAVGNWQLYSKLDTETDFILEGQVLDNSITEAKHSGIFVNFSSSNFNKYFFDDFEVVGSEYIPSVQNIERHSVVINEVMADPEPVVSSLPNAEYVELYNRSSEKIDISGWKILCGNNSGVLQNGEIEANGYAILCSTSNRQRFEQYGNVVAVSSFPSLTNSGNILTLETAESSVVSWCRYSDLWYGNDSFRKDGGFSLEKIDANNLNESRQNWLPSQSLQGGTPGQKNSVATLNIDKQQPTLSFVSLLSADSVALTFDKEMNASSLQNIDNYNTGGFSVSEIIVENPENKRVTVVFSPKLLSTDTAKFSVKNFECVSGFYIENSSFRLAIPSEVDANDIVINEVMFNPAQNQQDYIELLNRSTKVIDVSKLFLSRKNGENLENKRSITNERILAFPEQYILLTSDLEGVCEYFDCDATALKIACSLPSLPNAEGNVVVCKSTAEIVDEFAYSEKMHDSSIANKQGVSLERINPNQPTQSPDNWHSAAFTAKYGTPSKQNSQYSKIEDIERKTPFWLDYDTFSPDNDGYRDFLNINYELEGGYKISATIYTPNGLTVRSLANNLLLGRYGTIRWDGTNDSGSACRIGIYVIKIDAHNSFGKTISKKIVCVLGGK